MVKHHYKTIDNEHPVHSNYGSAFDGNDSTDSGFLNFFCRIIINILFSFLGGAFTGSSGSVFGGGGGSFGGGGASGRW